MADLFDDGVTEVRPEDPAIMKELADIAEMLAEKAKHIGLSVGMKAFPNGNYHAYVESYGNPERFISLNNSSLLMGYSTDLTVSIMRPGSEAVEQITMDAVNFEDIKDG